MAATSAAPPAITAGRIATACSRTALLYQGHVNQRVTSVSTAMLNQ